MAMLSSPESEEPRGSISNNPLFVHRRIEDDIEHFVENFKQKSSVLDRRPSSDSGDSSGWTSSVFSATDTPSTDSPDRDGELLPLPEEDVHGRNGIIAESRRIAQWALRQSRYASSRDSCTCTYHPKIGECSACSLCPPEGDVCCTSRGWCVSYLSRLMHVVLLEVGVCCTSRGWCVLYFSRLVHVVLLEVGACCTSRG